MDVVIYNCLSAACSGYNLHWCHRVRVSSDSLSTLPIFNILPAISSRIECAVACSQDTACKSSLFDSFGVCRTFSDYSTFEQCASEDFYFQVFEVCNVDTFRSNALKFSSRKLLRIKVPPDLHLTYSKNGGNLGLVLKMKKYSLYLNFIDKTCKIYLVILVWICFIQYCSI